MIFNIFNAPAELLQDKLFQQNNVSVSVLRLDKIDPVVSGNKLFKLHYFLQEAAESKHKTILTFGGAYSNHFGRFFASNTCFRSSHCGDSTVFIVCVYFDRYRTRFGKFDFFRRYRFRHYCG